MSSAIVASRPDEDTRIRRILAGKKPDGRERPLELRRQAAMECLFDLALQSAMRLREMFTVAVDQVDFARRTIFLEKTKNGDKRQVPMTTVAQRVLTQYIEHVKRRERGMDGFAVEGGLLFPWWDGKTASLAKTTALLSWQFARLFDAAGSPDLRFHDRRHEARSRLFERTKLSDIQISRITGHKERDLNLAG